MDWDRFWGIVFASIYAAGLIMMKIYGETLPFILFAASLFFSKTTDWKLGGE
jgi:hypothetical protein